MEMLFSVATFFLFLIFVALYSYRKTKGVSESGVEGFFLAGRGLSGYFIAGSLLLSNLSAEQLVGLNGNAYRFDISGMAWESTAAVATIMMAVFFLPRFLRRGITTMPQFLEERFDSATRRTVSVMLLVGYAVMANPCSLYLGAITMNEMFDVQKIFHLPDWSAIGLLALVMGAVGGLYATLGGLKAVAISDTISGLILLVAAMLIPVLGLIALGEGSFLAGGKALLSHPEQLNAIGSASSSVPFSTVFTGMLCANMFYWCTNQMIIQRALGAKSLAESQKGVLLAGSIKLLVPLAMVLPGLIAFNLFGPVFTHVDYAYPALVKAVIPWWLIGMFAAAIFGTVISHFNSVVNSSATLFVIDLYAPLTGCQDEKKLVYVGKITSVVVSLISIVIAPLLLWSPNGIFDLMRRFTGFYSIPIITIVLVGFLTRRVPALAAKWVLGFHVIAYGLYTFAGGEKWISLHFIHVMGILFLIETAMMLSIGKVAPGKCYVPDAQPASIPMEKWRYAHCVSVIMMVALISIFIALSPLGLANPEGLPASFYPLLGLVWAVALILIVGLARHRRRQERVLLNENSGEECVRDRVKS
ncbi:MULTISPECIES: solute:sodium symporter family transporter [Citrobacter]|uniref:solute:sodium symporter family transporter n=1 Tax=Citrobacter TaxID=544 RepID=UPI0006429125|nr:MULTISPECIES: solute:sodium symporter family transporter [Citrobacter]KLQ27185.1 sodium transporter [Citrobacter braakii]MBA8132240.1 solute:sodium symporter family transporter [Citrobacter sp. RHBSTW-00013]MDM3410278.1 solute:sodium symporter family transporter [Citrobacter sp. Cb018]QLZ43573.1 solute:sodium symporter family transporter [Citrobacter sp. RHBSTW-00127]WFX01255.1 solute:sodium symporter family transporter [Citrobacter braakii]